MNSAIPGQRKPEKFWLLYPPMAGAYALIYLHEKLGMVPPLGDWIAWTIIALALLAPPFILGFTVGADWVDSRGKTED